MRSWALSQQPRDFYHATQLALDRVLEGGPLVWQTSIRGGKQHVDQGMENWERKFHLFLPLLWVLQLLSTRMCLESMLHSRSWHMIAVREFDFKPESHHATYVQTTSSSNLHPLIHSSTGINAEFDKNMRKSVAVAKEGKLRPPSTPSLYVQEKGM